MSQIIQHRRGSLASIKSLNTNGPIHRGEILVATGSLYISSGSSDSDNYHLSASIFFGGSLTTDGSSNYRPLTQVISGSGLPSVTTGTYGRTLDGILYINTDDNKLYRLVATADANPATSGNFTGSHQLISGGGGGGSSDYPSIGTPDDGTYTDGVFPFTATTTIANAIDQINEVLKVIAPSSPPNYEGLSFAASGTKTGKLSFGDNHAISSYTNVGDNIGQTYGGSDYASIQTKVPATGSSPAVVSSDNTGGFKGIYGDASSTTGTVNDIATRTGKGNPAVGAGASGAYNQYAVGDGQSGVLAMYLNGALFLSGSLSGSVASITKTSDNSSNLTISATQSVFFSDGIQKLDGAEYRTFTYSINTADMRNGHNYITVRHELAGSTRTAAKHDWVHDNFAGTMTADSSATSSLSAAQGFDASKIHNVSGIKFYSDGFEDTIVQSYTSSFSGIYQNVYPSSGGITMTVTNQSISNSTKKIQGSKIETLTGTDATRFPDLDVVNFATTTEDSNMTMSFAATPTITTNIFHSPPGGETSTSARWNFGSSVTPLLRSALTPSVIPHENRFMYNTLTSGSTENNFETFRGERFRQDYAAGSIGTTIGAWTSTQNLAAAVGGELYATQYNSGLSAPERIGNSGDFTTFHGPSSQPNYTTGNRAAGTRKYVRFFKNTGGDGIGSKNYSIQISVVGTGDAVLVTDNSSLFTTNSSKFRMYWFNSKRNTSPTAWLDVLDDTYINGAQIKASFANTDGIECPGQGTMGSRSGNISYTVATSNSPGGNVQVPKGVVKLAGGASDGVIAQDDIIGIMIEIPEGFTHHIDAIRFNWGTSETLMGTSAL